MLRDKARGIPLLRRPVSASGTSRQLASGVGDHPGLAQSAAANDGPAQPSLYASEALGRRIKWDLRNCKTGIDALGGARLRRAQPTCPSSREPPDRNRPPEVRMSFHDERSRRPLCLPRLPERPQHPKPLNAGAQPSAGALALPPLGNPGIPGSTASNSVRVPKQHLEPAAAGWQVPAKPSTRRTPCAPDC